MPRRVHIDSIPFTPRGLNRCFHDVSADEIEIDEEITIKTSLCQEPVLGKAVLIEDLENKPPSSGIENSLVSSPISRIETPPNVVEDGIHTSSVGALRLKSLIPQNTVSGYSRDNSLSPTLILNPRSASEFTEKQNPASLTEELKATSFSPPKTVSELSSLVDVEEQRLRTTNSLWEAVLREENSDIPEEAFDSIRPVVGQCNLLLSKKFPFCKELIKDACDGNHAGLNDLLGYWEIVSNEIQLLDASFERLRCWRDVHCWQVDQRPITPLRFQPGKPLKKTRKRISDSKLSKKSTRMTANRAEISKLALFIAQKKLKRESTDQICEKWAVPTGVPVSSRDQLLKNSHTKKASKRSSIVSPSRSNDFHCAPFRRPATGTPIPLVRPRGFHTPSSSITENVSINATNSSKKQMTPCFSGKFV